MRMTHLMVAGVLAMSAALAAPAQAKNSDAQKGEDKSTTSSSSCSAYQQAPDGSWEQLPCKEAGERGQPQTQQRSPARGPDREER
ncbi:MULTISPECIES: hypothetical protein [Bradyrhizobium]|jgi:hypothetical protein|uniref:Uncharacterized protein n=1 Tax=Bradyrhizobium ottawaense TaxID=931866 RepID=A0A2U8PGD7_9BRAD|nr:MULTISPECIES: hypothetical protein [Bradyrhizobium]AWL96397.1 hypothetical protein CIT37_32935 [Bradyrhizobium ottawaense]MBR1288277.1 hypothetical protein [Bradyrhizobium ottawaense]MBR1328190.1 hypothetical protein [Bradyrhizobium ottawaense]MBR1334041.1 hypothetical protein [Bradyrhizobium ottawaense]MBR1363892.1 hypothetical protein [Bradyrhizobium ottawaense]